MGRRHIQRHGVLPIIAMVVDTFLTQRRHGIAIKNKVVWTFALGTAIGHLVGAGVFGFAHAAADQLLHPRQPDYSEPWTLGLLRRLCPAQSHHVLVRDARLRGISHVRGQQRYGDSGSCVSRFWGSVSPWASLSVIQTYVERVMGEGFMTAQGYMQLWFKVVLFFGVFMLGGLILTFWNIMTGKQSKEQQ